MIGGSFNNYGFSDLGNGGFNINGSRSDENNITVDGATAIRTRSNGAIVGIQNVDAIQEVQILTGDYMPEYGRVSGGQIRMVTKSGSNRFSGSGSYFLRDDKLQANTWARNRSPNSFENSGAAPFDYKQYAYSVGGPIPVGAVKNKLFFFAAQEWVNYFAVQTNTATVPTAKMRAGDFSELLAANNGFFSGARVINDPLTGQPFPGNIIPTGRLSPTGLSLLNAYPLPTPGFRQGSANAIISSENPQDQRKDNIRLDYRLNDKNQFTYRYGKYNWKAIDAFRGTFALARTQWDRPNTNQTASWTTTLSSKLVNEFSFTHSVDDVAIDVYRGTDSYQRIEVRHQLSVHLPGGQGHQRPNPHDQHRHLHRDRRQPVSLVVAGTDLDVQRSSHAAARPPHAQGRRAGGVFRRGRLRPDQRATPSGTSRTIRMAASCTTTRQPGPTAPAPGLRTRHSACSTAMQRLAVEP